MVMKGKTRKVLKKNMGGPLPVGRMLAQNAKDLSSGGLDVGSGFGGGGKAFAGMLGKAMKKTARQLSGIEKNPRNVSVDSQGMAQPAKMAGMVEAPKMMKKGGMVKCPRDGMAQRGRTKAKRG